MIAAVLGAGGLLGRRVVRELGATARPLTRAECDITNADDVHRATTGATLIVNCAAWTDVDGAEANVDAAFRVNAIGAENAARAAHAHGAKLVHVSTGFVFDGAEDRPYDEFDLPHPLSVYGRSKWAGEQLVLAACDRVFILRLQSLYGVGGKNFASSLRARILAGKPLTMDAHRPAQPTWSGAAARQILHLAATDFYGTYNATCGGETTWAAFARAMAEHLKVEPYWSEVTTDAIGATAVRPKNHVLARRMLALRGLDVMSDWAIALTEYLEEAGQA
ncbi:dTDP-4-dehydrorhamnose reductase [soil metagenome]